MCLSIPANPDSQQGFNLIEMMIALILATFGLLAAGQVLGTAIRCASLSSSKGTAVVAARSTLESLQDLYSRNPSHGDLSSGNHGPREINFVNPIDETVLNRYRITWSAAGVSDPRPGASPDAVRLSVSVTPIRSDGTSNYSPPLNRALTFETILSPAMP